MNKTYDLTVIYVVYAIATYVAFQTGLYYSEHVSVPIIRQKFNLPTTMAMEIGFVADCGATLVIFIFSIIYNNSSMYDAYCKYILYGLFYPLENLHRLIVISTNKLLYIFIGSVAPQILSCFWIAEQGFPQYDSINSGVYIRKWIVMAIMFLWSNRLTYNWARSWTGFNHEDWRYVEVFQKDTKNKFQYWVESFAGIHFFPTAIVFFALIPAYYILHDLDRVYVANNSLNVYDLIGCFVGFGAVLLQGTADNQLYHFRQTNKVKGKVLSTGVWSCCRHPNYGGEILHW